MPCCISTTSESQPIWAMTSAAKLLGMPHQLLTTGLPACQLSRIRLARIARSPRQIRSRRSRHPRGRVSSAPTLDERVLGGPIEIVALHPAHVFGLVGGQVA